MIPLSIIFFERGNKMDQNEFIELYVNASEEVKDTIQKVLEEDQLPSEPPDLPLNTAYINK